MTKFIIVFFAMLLQLFADNNTKDFPKNELIFDTQLPKQDRFVSALVPVILSENEQILKDRKLASSFFEKYDSNAVEMKISKADFNAFLSVAIKYKITDPFSKKEYNDKIDTVPVSLALSQAVLESGWGESRVAKKANNLFGQKSFTGKKDLASLGGDVKYALFDGYIEAVRSYMLNLNSHEAYGEFRKKRAMAKVDNKLFSGISAARTLKNYSEIGRGYTVMLTELIQDKFREFDAVKNRYSTNAFDARFLQTLVKM